MLSSPAPCPLCDDLPVLERLAALFGQPVVPPLVLAGSEGAGGALLTILVLRRPERFGLLRCDLEGFEPGEALVGFVEYQLEKLRGTALGGRRAVEEALGLLEGFKTTSWNAALFSLLLRCEGTTNELVQQVVNHLRAEEGYSRRALFELLEGLSPGRRWIIEVDLPDLNFVLAGGLLEAARRNPNLILAICCRLGDTPGALFAGCGVEFERFEVPELDDLGERSRHLPELPSTPGDLEKVLFLGALCGESFPLDLLLDFLEVPVDRRDETVEQIDFTIAADSGAAAWVDRQYRHPSFPGYLVYGFPDPIQRRLALARAQGKAGGWSEARGLFAFFEKTLAPTRGVLRVLLSIADFLEDKRERDLLLWQLHCWGAPKETSEISERLARAVEAEDVTPDFLWRLLESVLGRWPPAQCIPLLEACARWVSDLPPSQAGDIHCFRASALRGQGRLEEAVAAAHLGLEAYARAGTLDDRSIVVTRVLLGLSLHGLGRLEAARENLDLALAAVDVSPRGGCEDAALILEHLSAVARDMGRPDLARVHLERILRIWGAVYEEDHPNLVNTLKKLASITWEEGDLAVTRAALERVVRLERGSPRAAVSLKNLGQVAREMGDLPFARASYERALALEETYEDGKPSVDDLLKNLGQIAWEQGDLTAASFYLERALAVDERILGPGHPQVTVTLKNLADLYGKIGDLKSARRCLEKVLAYADGSHDPSLAVTLEILSSILRSLGELGAAEQHSRRALELARDR